jgi:hypothetical protein
MKESELNDQVNLKLHDFESITDIQPTAEWNLNLMKKIDSSHSNSGLRTSAINFIAMLLIIVDVSIILSSIVREPKQSQLSENELQVVVNEFLINPVSINN